MMWVFVGDGADKAVVWLLDSAARGQKMPSWADEFGWLLIFLAGLVTVAAAIRWVWQWWSERGQPEPAEAEKPWWATKAQAVDSEPERTPGYRGQRRASRKHVIPAHPPRVVEPVTQVIPLVSDEAEATAVIPRGGAQ